MSCPRTSPAAMLPGLQRPDGKRQPWMLAPGDPDPPGGEVDAADVQPRGGQVGGDPAGPAAETGDRPASFACTCSAEVASNSRSSGLRSSFRLCGQEVVVGV